MSRKFHHNAKVKWLLQDIKPILSSTEKGVEIGLAAGFFSKSIKKYLNISELHGVDKYEYDSNFYDMISSNTDISAEIFGEYVEEYSSQDKLDSYFENTVKHLNAHLSGLHRLSSLEAVELFDDASLDFVYIDADHSYEAVKADLQAWWPKVKSGGVMSGDDYETYYDSWGVIQAVDEFAADNNLTLNVQSEEESHTRQWWFTKA